MRPSLKIGNGRNGRRGDTIIYGYFSQYFPIRSPLPYFSYVILCQLRQIVALTPSVFSLGNRKFLILASRHPAKIRDAIILFVGIFVMNFAEILRVRNEGGCHKPVRKGQPFGAVAAEKELLVPPLNSKRFEEFSPPVAINSSRSSMRTYFKHSREWRLVNRLPNFIHNNMLNKTLHVVKARAS